MFARAAFSVALLCWAGIAHAGDKPLYQTAPAWVVKAPEPDFAKLTDSDPVLVLFDGQQRVENAQVWSYFDRAMRVVSPQMLSQIGQLQLPWQPDAGDLIVHRAEIIRGTERIDLLAKGQRFQVLQREEQLEKLEINGMLTATMQVEGLRVGDVVRLTYSTTIRDKALAGNVQGQMPLLTEPARAKFGRARFSWLSAKPLKWQALADGVAPQVTKSGGFEQIEVALPLAKPTEMPSDAPTRYQRPPVLEFTSFADWPEVSRTFAPLYRTEGLIAPGSPLAAEVAKIAAKTKDQRERAALALQLVQDEVRYLYRGMDGGNYVPQTPMETWSLRYGDCKAKTLLLLAMLGQLGVSAEPVLASTALGDMVPQRLPSASAFDHVIVHATIDGKSLWLDGTSNGTRLDDIESTPPFRYVLPLRAAGAGLMPLPMRTATRPVMGLEIEYDQSAGLNLPTPFTIRFLVRGQLAELLRVGSTQMGKDQLSEMAETMVSDVVGDALIGERSIVYDPATATATVTASGVVGPLWQQRDGRYRLGVDRTVSQLNFEPDRTRAAWKDIPATTGPAIATMYRIRVKLPDSGAGFVLEGDTTLPARLAGVLMQRKAEIAGGWVTVEDRADSTGDEIAAADIPAARAQVTQAKSRLLEVVSPEKYPSLWKEVLSARKNNGFASIVAVYSKVIADKPGDVGGYQNRAGFYTRVWDWKAASADLDKAIAIEPSASLYLQRSYLKEAVKADAAALADAETALRLDPSLHAAIRRVAQLRFRAGRRDEALAMIAAKAAEGGKQKNGYVTLQADLLAEAGRTDEAIALLDAIIKTNPGSTSLLNSRCWLKGTMNVSVDSGLKDCTRAIELAESPAHIYDSRALIYYRLGQKEDALADLDAALEVAPDQGASLYLRGVIRKEMGDRRGEEDLAVARMMWPRVDEEYAGYGIKP